MYIQITNRCNMKCAHCCYSCNKKGIDMKFNDVLKLIQFCGSQIEQIFIGGGEPTLHPKFKEILMNSIWYNQNDEMKVGIITNGSNYEISKRLFNMMDFGIIYCELSYDSFHNIEMVDKRIYQMFARKKAIREIHQPIKAGRCDWGRDACCCSDLVIEANGNAKFCGCENSLVLGNIHSDKIEEIFDKYQNYGSNGECWNYVKEQKGE